MYLAVVVLIGPLEASADDLRPAPSGVGQREPSATRTTDPDLYVKQLQKRRRTLDQYLERHPNDDPCSEHYRRHRLHLVHTGL